MEEATPDMLVMRAVQACGGVGYATRDERGQIDLAPKGRYRSQDPFAFALACILRTDCMKHRLEAQPKISVCLVEIATGLRQAVVPQTRSPTPRRQIRCNDVPSSVGYNHVYAAAESEA
jgi:hypothetical protein